MAVFDNMNFTYSPGVAPSVVEYHNKSLLRNVKPKLIWERDMQHIPLPAHNGRRVKFRRYVPFKACTEPLAEGITPPGQELQMTEMFATILPYGRHVELTDEMDWAMLDDMHRITNEALSDQAALTLDTLARDAYCAGLNVRYANNKTARSDIAATDKLTYNDIKLAVRDLKKRMAKKFPDGFYHAFVDADTVFDLTTISEWIDVAKYQDKRKIETGELGCLAGVKFFETQNPKVFAKESYLYGTTASVAVTANTLDETKHTIKITVPSDRTQADPIIRALTGKLVDLSGAGATETVYIENVAFDGTVTLRWNPQMTVGAGVTIVPTGAGASDADVHCTVIYGQDYAGCVSLEGGKNAQVIIKPVGSSGALDPINQRGTVAWKVKGVCYTPIQDAFAVRIEHGATA